MTPLRQRMIDDLQLRGSSDRTVEAYVRAVVQLAQFHHTAPDQRSEEQVRQYLLHLRTVQKVARGTHTIALCGIKCFYQQTLARPWNCDRRPPAVGSASRPPPSGLQEQLRAI